jgi:hypothetical protein
MSADSSAYFASRKWISGLILSILVATSFLINPQPAASSTLVTVPVVIQNVNGDRLPNMTLEVCHQGSGEWECDRTLTSNANGVATISESLPNGSGYIQMSSGGHPSIYSQGWQGVDFNRGVPNWQPILELDIAEWIEVSVTVVDVQPLTPVAIRNEWIQISTQMGDDQNSWTMTEWEPTNDDGIATFYLDAKRWGENPILADVGIGGYSAFAPEQAEVAITDSVGSARIETRSVSYTLSGIISDENGDPLANREICMFYHHPNTQKRIDFDETTGPAGEYEIEGVGHNWINFEPIACGYYDDYLTYDWFNGYDVDINLATSTAELDVQFTRTGIEVTVVDENGDPAAFVQLGLDEVDPQHESQDYRRQAVTNQQGVAYFSSLEPNKTFELSYRSADRSWEAARYQDSASTQLVLTGGRNSVTETDLVLEKTLDFPETPVTVSGTVLGVGNTPLANASVQVNANFGLHGSNYMGFRLRTDANGAFSVSGLPYGYISLEISAKGHRLVRQEFQATEVKGVTYNQGSFRLRASTAGVLEYAGVLRDSTGAPIPEMELVLHNPFESGRGVHKVETDAQGRFSFTGLNEGHHWMYANSSWEDYEWSSWGFNLTTSRTSVALVLYERGVGIVGPQASISGRVIEYLDVEGIGSAVGVENICVDVYPVEGGEMSRGSTDADGNWTATGLVDGQDYYIGTPANCPLPAGENQGESQPERFDFENQYEWPQPSDYIVEARVEGGTPHLWTYKEVSDFGTGSISGRVKDADTYRNMANITINIERANGGKIIEPVTTDSRGEYEFSNLPAGEYYLSIPGTSIDEDSYWDTWLSVEVTTEPNRANILLYKQASESEEWGAWISTLIGRVFDENGSPHGLAKVEVYDPSLEYTVGYGETDNDGNFEISNLPNLTDLILKIFPWWTEIAVYFEEIRIDQTNQKDMGRIDLEPGNAIVGEVANIPQGVEVRKIFAELVDAETGAFIIAAEVDSETGQYRIGQVPNGDYKVRFTQNSKGNVWSEFAQDSVSMSPVYWNNTLFGTTDIMQASEITVTAGTTVPAKNISFSEGSIIQGNVSIASSNGTIPLSGNRFIWVNLMKKGANGVWNYHSWAEVSANSKYRFQFVGLAAGEYKIEFIDSRTGSNALTSNYNGGAATIEEAPVITLDETERLQLNHVMTIAPPQRSAAAFDLDDLGEARLAELKDQISLAASALPGSEIDVFVGTEFTGEFVSAFANSTPVLLGDWKQVDSRGYISVTIPTSLPAGAHRIAAQDSRGLVFGWAPITIKGPDVASASPTVTKVKPRTSMSVVEAEPEEAEKEPATTEEVLAAPAATDSSGDWLLPLAGGFLLIAAVGSAWALRTRRVGIRRK